LLAQTLQHGDSSQSGGPAWGDARHLRAASDSQGRRSQRNANPLLEPFTTKPREARVRHGPILTQGG